ncbi:MAG: Pyruvate:ferredoxin oxidoreductase alpha subunit [Caldanaerobacter subterraneus]|uniref:Pyruvate:ferredoxin oxidoreductase and related 2-oxoacid:ferredoxin oxidoreductases, alpha subunit n=4 Tax=Caldanaerobacter subterraneus TaxID=911092 RepID=Q8RA88_CALS4|nr:MULTISPECIES: 2-oxoacid:acceptor oxidoreductase subunit alpha [Caldanaerobacter]AAM24562.1 Pyruvate:ferredoxin oxidoreductase and related 2-oxoacid:ferredoxin oxidoreductases, alpha subunit [Caldanaerobacter subterraneus subsp. tengcongensis MB4]ERM91864.1 2-oxoglutarate ferredoxin oxidoreductase subunit alpha [Caldanaerobacter subterraneus subsp. yonseiensis KB-1]KKC29711.1 2-oxoglutarate ferredoxin oxidoreductase subunit alpha [Caldanaerobacter subterraneus subsp. pacificus DSM 12653]KUK09
MSRVLMQGNEAVVEGAIRAGMRFYAGYPITPSTEIAELCAEKLPFVGGKFIQMEDEIASMAAIIGASLAGLKAMTATSGPGFSLMQENIGFAAMAEVPCVVVDVQRMGPSTGMPTLPAQGDVMQSRWGTHGDHSIIVLSPSSVKEAYYVTIQAFNLSEKYRTPVVILMDEVIGHLRETVNLDEYGDIEIIERKIPEDIENYLPYKDIENGVAPLIPFGKGVRYHVTGLVHNEKGLPTNDTKIAERLIKRLVDKIEKNKEDIVMYEEKGEKEGDILFISFGSTSRSVEAAEEELKKEGFKVGIFRPITIWPFPDTRLRKIYPKFRKIFVVEMNRGQLYYEVDRVVKREGAVENINKANGEFFTPCEIVEKVKERIKNGF